MLFNEDKEEVLVGGNAVTINIWSIKTGEKEGQLKGEHKDSVTCMTIEHKILFSGSDDMTIVFWDLFNRIPAGVLRGHEACNNQGKKSFV